MADIGDALAALDLVKGDLYEALAELLAALELLKAALKELDSVHDVVT